MRSTHHDAVSSRDNSVSATLSAGVVVADSVSAAFVSDIVTSVVPTQRCHRGSAVHLDPGAEVEHRTGAFGVAVHRPVPGHDARDRQDHEARRGGDPAGAAPTRRRNRVGACARVTVSERRHDVLNRSQA
jgi:hypothetical protein